VKKKLHKHVAPIAFVIAGLVVIVLCLFAMSRPFNSQVSFANSIAGGLKDVFDTTPDTTPKPQQYIEVIDSCGPYYEGACVNMRTGPGVEYPSVLKLRNGMVLKVVDAVTVGDKLWYKIGFDGSVRYPERVKGDWYVESSNVRLFTDIGQIETTAGLNASSTKRIVVDRSDEMLYAYDGDTLFMKQSISVGLELTPTPRGTFWIYKKTPDAYMQGPLPGVSEQYYDLPGVPWDLYFTYQGGALHGAYWHNHFGEPWSHGCVNLPPEQAKILYDWAELGTPVTVHD
jgi:lipoprotein-anchoring transpeptidase ErfK/SrfK